MSDVNFDNTPDVRDGLSKKERAILCFLQQAQQELGGRNVPTIMLYGRVLELVDISQEEFQTILSGFVGETLCTLNFIDEISNVRTHII